jgi:hypothetical protein
MVTIFENQGKNKICRIFCLRPGGRVLLFFSIFLFCELRVFVREKIISHGKYKGHNKKTDNLSPFIPYQVGYRPAGECLPYFVDLFSKFADGLHSICPSVDKLSGVRYNVGGWVLPAIC